MGPFGMKVYKNHDSCLLPGGSNLSVLLGYSFIMPQTLISLPHAHSQLVRKVSIIITLSRQIDQLKTEINFKFAAMALQFNLILEPH